MENSSFITITGINHYFGKKPFEPGRIVKLEKEPDNEYDREAIRVVLPFIDTIGYVANSTNTVYDGTISAGRLYDRMDDYGYAQIMFVTHTSAIAITLDKDEVESDDDDETPPVKAVKKSGKKKNKKNPVGFSG